MLTRETKLWKKIYIAFISTVHMFDKHFLLPILLLIFITSQVLAETKNPQAITEHQKERAKKEETRLMIQEKKQELRQHLQEIQEKVSAEIAAFREKRAAFAEAKKAFKTAQHVTKTCKGKGNNFCQQAREDAYEKKQEVVQHAQNEIISVLTKAKERVTTAKLPDEKKTTILTTLQSHISAITNPEATTNESTPEDTAQQIYLLWKEVRRDLKKAQFHAHTAHIRSILERLKNNEQRLNTLITEKNSTTHETFALIKSRLETVNSIHQHLTELLATEEQTPEKIKTITGLIKDGQQVLKETHQFMKTLLKKTP